ncbi:MAG: PDZ domain-containing protein [Chromatiales bacterium]
MGLREESGAIVKGVVLDGLADDADLRPRDVVTHINGIPIRNARHGLDIITRLKPGSAVSISIIRDGRTLRREAIVAERPHVPLFLS